MEPNQSFQEIIFGAVCLILVVENFITNCIHIDDVSFTTCSSQHVQFDIRIRYHRKHNRENICIGSTNNDLSIWKAGMSNVKKNPCVSFLMIAG